MQMPHSLRVRIKRMRYKGYITDNDCQRLCDALDMEQAVKNAVAELKEANVWDSHTIKAQHILEDCIRG